MKYKVIPGPQIVEVKRGKYNEATDLFQNMINEQAAQGWTYHSMETITTQQQVGCLFNKSVLNINIYMLIFCQEEQ